MWTIHWKTGGISVYDTLNEAQCAVSRVYPTCTFREAGGIVIPEIDALPVALICDGKW